MKQSQAQARSKQPVEEEKVSQKSGGGILGYIWGGSSKEEIQKPGDKFSSLGGLAKSEDESEEINTFA